jgi:PEP-CTERM motif
MKSLCKVSGTILAATAFLALAVTPAKANLLPFLAGTSPAGGGNTTFTYSVSLSNDERIDASGTGNTAFFTIYDFAGYVAGSAVAPSGWSLSAQNTGITPDRVTVPDNPNIVNLTWTYVGSTTVNGTGQTFTGFAAQSIYSAVNMNGYFSQQSTKSIGATAGGRDFGGGPEAVPMPASAVPEPSTLALLSAGFALLAVRFRTRNK